MSHIEESIEVDVPVRVAYNQWTQFEEFPHFMEGVKEVRQIDDKHLHWRATIAGKEVEWDAEITQQEPDRRIGWRSTSGAPNAGSVSFYPIGSNHTKATLRMEYDPDGAVENVGTALGVVSARVKGDLKRFKEFIEKRGQETGAWRGEIHGDQVRRAGQAGA
jgi:uncharacterized membrane protein